MAIDTRMNGIIHAALRRDLDRTALVLADGEPAPERLRAIGTHVVWLMDFLHTHHTGEDEHLFPLLRRNNPRIHELLDDMASEHAAIADAVTALRETGGRAAAGEPVAGQLRDAVAALRSVLDPHLEHEERDLSPVVPESVTEAEWREFERSNTRDTRPPELAFIGHWMLDNLDETGAAVVRSKVPAVPRFVMLRFLGGRYRERAAACWGGTPAAALRSEPLV
jgi:hemerythrin-like domain-containing protein